jgi:hypothetical protein
MRPTRWFANGTPKDMYGRDIFPKFENYVPPISLKVDQRPYKTAKLSRENDQLIPVDSTVNDEYYIAASKPSFNLPSATITEPTNQYTIPSV